MELKAPLSISEQVERLKQHNLIIKNEDNVSDYLQIVSYYRLSGYLLQFRKSENDSDFILGTEFNTVIDIYHFDSELRHLLRKYIEIAEVYFRGKIANGFVMNKCKESPHDQHYDFSNYYNQNGAKEILNKFSNQQLNYYKDSKISRHHQAKYGNRFPLWVMTEMLSFSDISKLYNCMYYSEKDAIAKSVGTGRTMLENHLHVLSVLRNKCAHAARLYNEEFNPPVQFSSGFLRKNPDVKNDSLFAYILVLIRRMPTDDHKLKLIADIHALISKYEGKIDIGKIGFPAEYERIMRLYRFN